MIKKYQTYVAGFFIKILIYVSVVFLCLAFIINFFEELKYFENYDVGLKYPLLLTFLNSPSILFDFFHLYS